MTVSTTTASVQALGGQTLPTLNALLLIVLGAVVGAGVLLLIIALTPREPSAVASTSLLDTLRVPLAGLGRRGLIAVGVALVTLLVTRWVVAAGAMAVLVLAWPALFGGAKAERLAMARLEGLAAWTASLRDTIAGAVGLEQAIPATAHAAAPAIRHELATLSDRLRVRTPLPVALQQFADDLDDPSADLIV